MEIIRFDRKDLRKLKTYEIHSDIYNTESYLYLYKNMLLKLFASKDEDVLNNKLFVLNKLFYLKEYINIKEFVWPESLVKIGSINKGYTMEFIKNNTNLSLIFNSEKVSIEDKAFFLHTILRIIERIEKEEVLNSVGFQLGDIHEGNFIYDNKNNMLKVIDIDSAYIDGAYAPTSKYLFLNDKLWDFNSKYPLDENDRHIPSKNTTIISLCYLILNVITEEYSPDLSTKEFYNILNNLASVGFNRELLDTIFNIYKKSDNYFDYNLVDTITPKLVLKYKEKYVKK